ncbi:MAG: hypothetical protein Q8O82_14610 [Pseudorhodobacter sp.]|nr:hypothetical protein [Pseudorhodobacter sp.]
MYARNLMVWLHERLAERSAFEQTQERFEALRGYGLLPRGRGNASVRLSNEQISSAILGFAHPLPGFSGLASSALGQLRPVGGENASFRNEPTLLSAVANLVRAGDASSDLLRLTLSIERDFHDEMYHGILYFRDNGQARVASFVSKDALSLLRPGAEEGYDHERLDKLTAVQLSFGSKYFRDLSRTVSISRHLNAPFKTDWREYETEEERKAFDTRMGATRGSRFLNLGVDTQATWPNEPTRVLFSGHHLVLFPKTKDNSHSISVDLANERLDSGQARTLINRFLSLLSWCDNQHAILREGWSGSPVPLPVSKRDLAFATAHYWAFRRSIPEDEKLLRSLAYYREGLNAGEAGLATFAVLSFFKVFEVKYSTGSDVMQWVEKVFSDASKDLPLERLNRFHEDRGTVAVAEYVYKEVVRFV